MHIFTGRCTIVQSAVLRLHVVCLSVHLSVTLVDHDHISWKSLKLIARTISPTPSLIHLIPGEHGKILGRLEVGWEKVACWSTKAAVSLNRIKIGKVTMEGLYELTITLSNGTIPVSLPPLSQDWGFATPPKLQSLLSQERVKLQTSNLAGTFTGSIRTKAYLKRKGSVSVSRDCPNYL